MRPFLERPAEITFGYCVHGTYCFFKICEKKTQLDAQFIMRLLIKLILQNNYPQDVTYAPGIIFEGVIYEPTCAATRRWHSLVRVL